MQREDTLMTDLLDLMAHRARRSGQDADGQPDAPAAALERCAVRMELAEILLQEAAYDLAAFHEATHTTEIVVIATRVAGLRRRLTGADTERPAKLG